MILIQAVLVGLTGWPSAPADASTSRPALLTPPKFYSAALNRLIDDPNWVALPEALPAPGGRQAAGLRARKNDQESPPLGSSFMPWLGHDSSSASGTGSSHSSDSRSSRSYSFDSRSSRSSRDSSSRSTRSTRESSRSRREQIADYRGYGSDDAGRKVRTVRSKTTRRDDGS